MAAKPSFAANFGLALRTQFNGFRRFLRNPIGAPAVCLLTLVLLNPGLRFGGLSLVAAILASLAVVPVLTALFMVMSRDFRRRARAHHAQEVRERMLTKLSNLVGNLESKSRHRFNVLHTRVNRLGDLFDTRGEPVRPGEYLMWIYLKLLLVRDHLENLDSSFDAAALEAERAQIETDLQGSSLSDIARKSRMETLQLIERRLLACRQRAVRADEVESDLARIEHKVALLHDRAAQQSTMGDAGIHIDMFSENPALTSLPVSASSQVEDLDAFFASHMEA